MTEEIRYNKDEKWTPYEQLAETPQQTITRLKQENKELKEENRYYKTELKLSYNELDKSNNWQIAERREKNKYRSALEEIRNLCNKGAGVYTNAKVVGLINEVLND